MTEPLRIDTPLDGDLAWTLSSVLSADGVEADRDQIENMARRLTQAGYGKVKPHSELGILAELPPMLDRFRKLADEYLRGPREATN